MDKVIVNDLSDTDLKTSDFYYDLPEERIAQHPLEQRDTSRLMVLDRHSGTLEDKHFYDIIDYLHEGDVLVINDSKVIPARIYGYADGKQNTP
jgi:S-adenosylmethionine:tRNA ribosyltransferase-isomerase